MEWLSRGAATSSGKYCAFLCAVRDAEAQAVLMAVRTVRLAMVGGWHKVPMRDKDGNYVFRRNPETGEILRDAQGRPEAELVDEYREPSSVDARWFLERRAREDFGGGGEAVTVNVNPAPTRPNPDKKQMLDLFGQAVQILVDNGMELPKPVMLEHEGQKAIETTATPAEETPRVAVKENEMSEEADVKARDEDDQR